MDNSEIVVGLDIGTTKIVAIVGRKNEFGKLEILGMGRTESIGVRRGVVANIEKTVQSIEHAVQEASLKSDVEIKIVNVGIAGQHIKSLQHRGIRVRNNIDQEINQEDIDLLISDMYKLVMLPGEEIIDVLPQEFTVDNEQGIKEKWVNEKLLFIQPWAVNQSRQCVSEKSWIRRAAVMHTVAACYTACSTTWICRPAAAWVP